MILGFFVVGLFSLSDKNITIAEKSPLVTNGWIFRQLEQQRNNHQDGWARTNALHTAALPHTSLHPPPPPSPPHRHWGDWSGGRGG